MKNTIKRTAAVLAAFVINTSSVNAAGFDISVFRGAGEKIFYYCDRKLESDIIDLTNAIRAENGLGRLEYDSGLAKAAYAHAKDMYEQAYFEHDSQNGPDFGTRVREYTGGRFMMLAENIANGNMSAETALNLWMNSAGHRANILNGSYKYIGVGYYGGYFVVDFAG